MNEVSPASVKRPDANEEIDTGKRAAPPLVGQTVLLTGGSRGLGRVFAEALGRAGARLVITGRSADTLAIAADELRSQGVDVIAEQADLVESDAMSRVVTRAVDVFGRVDVLINNAAVSPDELMGPTWQVDPDEWWRVFEINVRGTLQACRAVLSSMTARRSGRIINMVSHAGHTRWPHVTAYAVSKGAVIKLTENLAAELHEHDVSVFSFNPGLLDVGMVSRHLAAGPSGNYWFDRVGRWLQQQKAAGRFTSVDRSCDALLSIASGAADALSGQYLTPEDDLPLLVERASHRSARPT